MNQKILNVINRLEAWIDSAQIRLQFTNDEIEAQKLKNIINNYSKLIRELQEVLAELELQEIEHFIKHRL